MPMYLAGLHDTAPSPQNQLMNRFRDSHARHKSHSPERQASPELQETQLDETVNREAIYSQLGILGHQKPASAEKERAPPTKPI